MTHSATCQVPELLLWQLTGPPTRHTFHAESLLVAAVTCTVLGQGYFGALECAPAEGQAAKQVPMFMFASDAQVDEWFAQHCGAPTFQQALAKAMPALPAALRSLRPTEDEGGLRDLRASAQAIADGLTSRAEAGG